MKLARDHFGSHSLSRSGMTGKERVETLTERELSPKAPLAVNDMLMLVPRADFPELG